MTDRQHAPTDPAWEEPGDANVPPALAALCRPLPELLYVLYDPLGRRYCYRQLPPSEDCGLLCFTTPQQARAFAYASAPPWPYTKVRHVSLDQAHALARERHTVVNCLLFVDEASLPSVHYVK